MGGTKNFHTAKSSLPFLLTSLVARSIRGGRRISRLRRSGRRFLRSGRGMWWELVTLIGFLTIIIIYDFAMDEKSLV